MLSRQCVPLRVMSGVSAAACYNVTCMVFVFIHGDGVLQVLLVYKGLTVLIERVVQSHPKHMHVQVLLCDTVTSGGALVCGNTL